MQRDKRDCIIKIVKGEKEMILALLLISDFILGMIVGAIILGIWAWNFNKKENTNGNEKESRV